jgi:polysaccharide deacetylase family protein (PEP-CTERM system associated)
LNLLGIDFEDWYHPELVRRHLSSKKHEPVIINGIDKIIEILRRSDTYATFFMVGELLEHKPEILDKISSDGHEIGFHTMHHTRIDSFRSKEEFIEELQVFDRMTKGKSKGFRAPTFSINQPSSWAIDVLANYGYVYDSSIVPVKTNMYGMSNAEKKPYKISSTSLEKHDPNGKIIEFPIMITKVLGKRIPAGGGFYLRLLPLKLIKNAIKEYEKMSIPSTFYIHSWELTPEFMPRLSLPLKDRFITYYNLNKAKPKLIEILKEFKFTSFERYIRSMNFTN